MRKGLLPLQDLCIMQHPPSTSHTLKMANAMYAEMLEQFQHRAWLNCRSQHYTSDTSCKNLRMRIPDFLLCHDANTNSKSEYILSQLTWREQQLFAGHAKQWRLWCVQQVEPVQKAHPPRTLLLTEWLAFTTIQTVGLIKTLHPASTTNYQTVSLSTKLSNYKQRSERYRPLTLTLITHADTREIIKLYSKAVFIFLSTIMDSPKFITSTFYSNKFHWPKKQNKTLHTNQVWHRRPSLLNF
jgi:hypothetical protein